MFKPTVPLPVPVRRFRFLVLYCLDTIIIINFSNCTLWVYRNNKKIILKYWTHYYNQWWVIVLLLYSFIIIVSIINIIFNKGSIWSYFLLADEDYYHFNNIFTLRGVHPRSLLSSSYDYKKKSKRERERERGESHDNNVI